MSAVPTPQASVGHLRATDRIPGLITNGRHLPYNPKVVARARKLRQAMTTAEKKLWFGFLRGFQLRVLRQRPIGHYIVDFYCPNRKLVIEVDGDSHAAEDASKYDEERTAVLQGYGLTVIRFSNADVLHSFEEVCEAIRAALQTVNPPSPPSQGG